MIKTFKECEASAFVLKVKLEINRMFIERYGDEKMNDAWLNRASNVHFRLIGVELLKAISVIEDDPELCKKANNARDTIMKSLDMW